MKSFAIVFAAISLKKRISKGEAYKELKIIIEDYKIENNVNDEKMSIEEFVEKNAIQILEFFIAKHDNENS